MKSKKTKKMIKITNSNKFFLILFGFFFEIYVKKRSGMKKNHILNLWIMDNGYREHFGCVQTQRVNENG